MARIWLLIGTVFALAAGAGLFRSLAQDAVPSRHPERPAALARVSSASPFSADCFGPTSGTNFYNSAVEPSVAVDPEDSNHLIGVWQQDRWSNGAATGILTGTSFDHGQTWTISIAAMSQCSGGTFQRASDPWVSISPNGTAYQSALGVNLSTDAAGDVTSTQGVLVGRSTDGGNTWSSPVTIEGSSGSDKPSMTADPTNSDYIYAVWDNTAASNQPALFSRSTDGGATWQSAQLIYNPAADAYSSGNQIAVLPDGTLLDFFILGASNEQAQIVTVRSTDHGTTWSAPTMIAVDDDIGIVNSKTQQGIRVGGFHTVAVDMSSGAIYIAWDDARFSGNERDGIALSKSLDGGSTWSAPMQVNQAPNVQAFTPSIAVGSSGAVAITYYDFRKDTDNINSLLTDCWQIVSQDGGSTWRETPVGETFDMLTGLRSPGAGGYFLGDYQALTAAGGEFVPFFVATNPAASSIPSSVFALPQARSGDTSSTGRIEINRHPRPFQRHPKPFAAR
jgi:Neuraminidase (sialidase)